MNETNTVDTSMVPVDNEKLPSMQQEDSDLVELVPIKDSGEEDEGSKESKAGEGD